MMPTISSMNWNKEQIRQETMAIFLESSLFKWEECVIRYQDLYAPSTSRDLYEELYQSTQNITTEDARKILKRHWSTATPQESTLAIERLISAGKLRKVRLNLFKILRADPKPPANCYGFYVKEDKFFLGKRSKFRYKRGDCVRCGMTVANPNRHNNPLHTGDDCRLAQVKNILDE